MSNQNSLAATAPVVDSIAAPRLNRLRLLLILTTNLLACSLLDCNLNDGALADEPHQNAVSTWSFDGELEGVVGNVRQTAGPRSPEFPDLAPANRAIKLDGRGSRIVVAHNESLQFTGGDAITIQAWVSARRAKSGSHRYVIGKGRTNSKGFRRDNQNWAVRLTEKAGDHQLSFLFASDNDGGVNWHRWTSEQTVTAGDGWHHLAVSYRFGDPESIRGWIDGQVVQGKWDMAGATTASPITDKDDVWIGSSMGGSASSSFFGSLDSISVHRRLFDDEEVERLYQRDESIERVSSVEKPTMPELGELEPGIVHHHLIEGIPIEAAWPEREDLADLNQADHPGSRWSSQSFLIPRLPMRFDDWGIRSDWKSTVLLRVAADVRLPTDRRRYMLRARSLARLWIDGKLVAQTQPQKTSAPSGEEPITPLAEPPHPGLRVKGYRQQEVFAEYEFDHDEPTKVCRVVLELIAGGKNQRTETGEVCAAIETADGKSFDVLVPQSGDQENLSLQEPFAGNAIQRAEYSLRQFERDLRRRLAASQQSYWQRRHERARQWADQNPPPPIPAVNQTAASPVDAFLVAEIERQRKLSSQAKGDASKHPFFTEVDPLLQEHCIRCHGRANKGGLRLDSHAAAIAGGDSGWAAVVPGDPDDSELVLRLQSDDPDTRMPPEGEGLDRKSIESITKWIRDGAEWPRQTIDPKQFVTTDPVDDASFLRRAFLDTVGVPPTEQEAIEFLSDSQADRRAKLIDRLLDDDRVADHLVSDWQDMLAENPTLLNTSLNSTGPFRFFLHDAFVDRKPIDRIVTELILMRGDRHTGGSAGFGVAGENDSPLAAKAHIVASGLLAVDLQCARCHDSPFHSTTQEDLFSIAAMLNRKPLKIPATSRVPKAFFDQQQREPLIEATFTGDQPVEPTWPLGRFTGMGDNESVDEFLQNPADSRDRLAALITAPQNTRFPAVIVNRVWTRLMGAGLVASLNDWEHTEPNHPQLLQWLSHQFVASGYDIRHLMKLIMTSDVYARQPVDLEQPINDSVVLFAAPIARRLTAEQVVDSLFAATGREMDCEELTFVHDGRRPLANRLTLGKPTRAWMFATLNNERDRPSLSLPQARQIVDVLQAFGWNGSRQKPIHQRESDANVLQPGILANGVLTMSLSRAAVDSPLAELAVDASKPGQLVDSLFLRFLSRYPSQDERRFFSKQLAGGFANRVIPDSQRSQPPTAKPLPLVHWFNHLRPRANEIQQEIERRVRSGPAADPRLEPHWRQRYEDVVWSLINHDEFVWMP